MTAIRELTYLVFESSKLAEWEAFAERVLGMDVARHARALRMRIDDHAQRFLVREGPGEDLSAAGFTVADDRALESLASHLRAHGIETHRGTPEEIAEREVDGLVWARDPEGLRLEFVHGAHVTRTPARLPLVPHGFVTGDQGCGHIAIASADLATCEAFYRDVLGFALSDYVVPSIPGLSLRVAFYHVNPRHHTLGIAGLPVAAPKRLHHFMVQVSDLDAVGLALDRAKGAGVPIAMPLGRHPNDRMLSFYVPTPSGFLVEVGACGLEIRDESTWQVRTYDALSEWGHGF